MSIHLRTAAICGLMGVLVSTTSFVANADDAASSYEERSRADILFDEATELMAAGKYAEACPKLMESLIEDPTPQTSYNLAFCFERAKSFDDALAQYDETIEFAKKEGWRAEEVRARAAAQAKALRDRLSTLIIQLRAEDAAIAGLKVTVDGRDIHREASLRVLTRVEPGPHVVEVTAPRYEPRRVDVVAPPPPERAQLTVTPGRFAPQSIFAEETDASRSAAPSAKPSPGGPTAPEVFGVLWAVVGGSAAVVGFVLPGTLPPTDPTFELKLRISAGLIGGGLASTLGGILLAKFSNPPPSRSGFVPTPPRVTFAPSIASGFGGGFVSVRF